MCIHEIPPLAMLYCYTAPQGDYWRGWGWVTNLIPRALQSRNFFLADGRKGSQRGSDAEKDYTHLCWSEDGGSPVRGNAVGFQERRVAPAGCQQLTRTSSLQSRELISANNPNNLGSGFFPEPPAKSPSSLADTLIATLSDSEHNVHRSLAGLLN